MDNREVALLLLCIGNLTINKIGNLADCLASWRYAACNPNFISDITSDWNYYNFVSQMLENHLHEMEVEFQAG